jgi:hypothetical protein
LQLTCCYGDRSWTTAPFIQCQCAQRLDEQQRRWVAAIESKKIGYGGDTAVARITGLHVDTIRRSREELDAQLADRPTDRVRQPGAGRPAVKKGSTIVEDLKELAAPITDGDPMSEAL